MADDELALREEWAIFQSDPDGIREVFEANMGYDGISAQDLDIVTFPSGGMTKWAIPTLGDEQVEDFIDGIIVHHHLARAYWSESLDEGGGGQPPDCRSPNGKVGIGDPGGKCAACPLSEWGEDQEPPECREMKLVYFVTEDDLFPLVLRVPRTSVQIFKKYLLRAARKGVPYWGVVTRFGLEHTKNADGVEYAQLTCSSVKTLNEEDREEAKTRAEMFSNLLSTDEVAERAVTEE